MENSGFPIAAFEHEHEHEPSGDCAWRHLAFNHTSHRSVLKLTGQLALLRF